MLSDHQRQLKHQWVLGFLILARDNLNDQNSSREDVEVVGVDRLGRSSSGGMKARVPGHWMRPLCVMRGLPSVILDIPKSVTLV